MTSGTKSQHFLHYSQILSLPNYKGCSPWCRQHLISNNYQTYARYSLSCWQRWFNESVDFSLHYPNLPDGGRKPKAIVIPGHWAWHDIDAGQFYGAPPEELGRRLQHEMQERPLQKPRIQGGRERWWSCRPKGSSMVSQHWANLCLRWWHLAPSATKLFAWVPMGSGCCHGKAWTSATWEGWVHYTVKIVFISPEASISHPRGKSITSVCFIHYFKKMQKNERSLMPRIFLQLLPV